MASGFGKALTGALETKIKSKSQPNLREYIYIYTHIDTITYLTMGTLSYLVGSLKHTHVVAGFSEITVVALFAPLPLFLSSLSLAVQGNASWISVPLNVFF